VVLREDLRERRLGVLEGLLIDEARELELEAFAVLTSRSPHAAIPVRGGYGTSPQPLCQPHPVPVILALTGFRHAQGGGESLHELSARCVLALNSIAASHEGERVVVVTHGGFLGAAFKHATGRGCGRMPNAAINRLRIDPAAGSRSSAAAWTVLDWGQDEHLAGLLSTTFGGGDLSG
jgi:probable phosphoglycerate mutase